MPETPSPSSPVQELLDRILDAGRDVKQAAESGELREKALSALEDGETRLADAFGVAEDEASRESFRKNSRLAAGVGGVALLLASRSRRHRRKLGGLAALGGLAFAAYKANGDKLPTTKDEVIGMFKGRPAEDRAQALLTAMVAAAQVDGELSGEERAMLLAEAGDGEALVADLMAANPDAAAVAGLATSEQSAREIYAVSARVADGINPKERRYLDELAMALDLDPDTAARIETEVRV